MDSKPTPDSPWPTKILAIAQSLVQDGIISAPQLAVALESQHTLGVDLADLLVNRGYIPETVLLAKIAKLANVPYNETSVLAIDDSVSKRLSAEQARTWQAVALRTKPDALCVAVADPFNLEQLEQMRVALGTPLEIEVASKKKIHEAIDGLFGKLPVKERMPKAAIPQKSPPPKPDPASESDSPEGRQTIALVNEIFEKAVRDKASDVHFDAVRDGLSIRMRVDGVLEVVKKVGLDLQRSILSRVKILGSMDIAENRVPQDGRARLKVLNIELDIRIATFPTIHGESASIRLLSRENLISLDDLGFIGTDRSRFESLILKPHGLFLVTGPTGSGKTTTLYAGLQRIDRTRNRVLTVEDPVENEIEGVDQTQVNLRIGVTFPVVIRAMLREDPDVIMVGEIRDSETATVAVQAAMTGHVVLSTLHTNSAIGAIARLVDLKLERYLIASTVIGVMAQRLVRRICQKCKEEAPMPENASVRFGAKGAGLTTNWKGRGCEACHNRGHAGRIGLFELISMDEEFRVLINNKAPEVRLIEKASASGSKSILEDGIEKIKQGITSAEEVIRVCGDI